MMNKELHLEKFEDYKRTLETSLLINYLPSKPGDYIIQALKRLLTPNEFLFLLKSLATDYKTIQNRQTNRPEVDSIEKFLDGYDHVF